MKIIQHILKKYKKNSLHHLIHLLSFLFGDLKMLGFKIFDGDPFFTTNSLVSQAYVDGLALEVAFYNQNAQNFISEMLHNPFFVSNPHKSAHVNVKNSVVNQLFIPEKKNGLLQEIDFMHQLSIQHAVIHYQNVSQFNEHLPQLMPSALEKNLKLLYQIAKDNNIIFYIENTLIFKRHHLFNNLENHRIIWDSILQHNLQSHIGFCLDWGHVKAFSQDNLELWLAFAYRMKQSKIPIYMHVHDNDAKKDLHLSMHDSEALELSKFNKDAPFVHQLLDVMDDFSDSMLILETNTENALQHYLWLLEKIQDKNNKKYQVIQQIVV